MPSRKRFRKGTRARRSRAKRRARPVPRASPSFSPLLFFSVSGILLPGGALRGRERCAGQAWFFSPSASGPTDRMGMPSASWKKRALPSPCFSLSKHAKTIEPACGPLRTRMYFKGEPQEGQSHCPLALGTGSSGVPSSLKKRTAPPLCFSFSKQAV